ncbi:MAG: ferrous iron transporter B [Deltaproteobacteria bacterium]|nr:ferrous iron transporter B [Deltaproteobacteria bacterium]
MQSPTNPSHKDGVLDAQAEEFSGQAVAHLSNMRGTSFVHRMAIVGNVCVGKTSLFGLLCAGGDHSVNIPGSTQISQRGVLSCGPCGATKGLRRECAACASHHGRRGKSDNGGHPCFKPGVVSMAEKANCPAFLKNRVDFKNTVTVTHLFDTPGSATLAANGEDEMVLRDLILSRMVDRVLVVADAKNLRRSLALALELAEFNLPMVFDLNMLDEAENMGIEIDTTALTRLLGVPVGRTVAVEKIGVGELAELVLDPQVPNRLTTFPAAIEASLKQLEGILLTTLIRPRGLAVLLLCGDPCAENFIREHLGEAKLDRAMAVVVETQKHFNTQLKTLITDCFYEQAKIITDRVVLSHAGGWNPLVRFGSLAQHPVYGTLIGIVMLLVAYYWIGAFGATYVVDNLSRTFFDHVVMPFSAKIVNYIPSAFVRDAFMDPDFGLLPTGLFLALGIVFPVLFCFYSFQAVLEDSGYLPRLAILFDRFFRKIGLNGQGIIPLFLGFSCIAMAVITTRMLPTRKERNILTLLVVGVPCAPLFAVMIVILGKMPVTAALFVFLLIFARIIITGYVAAKVLPGRLPDLILEIPQMRIPRLHILWNKTWRRTWDFMREAVPVFIVASFGVFVFQRLGGLRVIEDLSHPVVHGLLGLPDQAVQVFIKTAIRRENGATELNLLRDQFDNVQLIVTMVVMTFLMPCINTIIVILKERGLKACLTILATVFVTALAAGTGINWVCRSFGFLFSG